ncbi:glycoside hydrolase family 127 protein [Reichenbachiella ulvae]|uniref:Glycoside hydrolase family 127 protein n=1 Tax=Reichenbachiella ulvae TaxID=2980104 RepID=A0ABT3CUA8_9BACT|nr:glycoside hydrolase family 127 protein [Reichenbachiella ulvae]MCV9387258.1 glycoside hydrolase family 127 protein [Reichenbachiella ulvae]
MAIKQEVFEYPLKPLNIRDVHVEDDFWLPIIQRVQQKTISYAIEKCQEEGRLDNFLIAGGKMEGEVKGSMPFDDTDVYKIIEGASNSLISSPDAQLEALLDSLIDIVAIGQEKDGYLTTWRTIDPASPPATWVEVDKGVRWEGLSMSHELYNAGHLYEAAVVHYKATGKRNFLDIAIKNADLICKTFGAGKLETVPGHQIIETGLIQLYRVTKKKEYLELAKYFLDARGDLKAERKHFGSYAQDHLPVVDQDEVVGHAVRAVYMYAAMTDIAALYQDSSYIQAVHALWHNMTEKKMYLTGGIGAKHQGESFGENYELPNLTAYNETCASIGDVYWNHRLFMLDGDKKYYDVIERTLYNGLISGLSLDGQKFFYPNALESDGEYKFNQGACTRKGWFDCSCCPTNVIRFIPAIPGLIYAREDNNVYVNLYIDNEAEIDVDGQKVHIKLESGFPWSGKGRVIVNSSQPVDFNLYLRIPGWSMGEVLPGSLYYYENPAPEYFFSVGEGLDKGVEVNGYYKFSNTWKGGSVINFDYPMKAHIVKSDSLVAENIGKGALEYGPIVYAVEEIDNPENFDSINLSQKSIVKASYNEEKLKGINELMIEANSGNFVAIPYYAWSNRGVGKMKVWLPWDSSQ